MLKVYNSSCKNCLLSKDGIVSGKRAKEIVQGCVKKQSHFICHKASNEGREILCNSFFKQFGHYSQMVRIAGRLNAIEFIDQPEHEKLIPYSKQNKN